MVDVLFFLFHSEYLSVLDSPDIHVRSSVCLFVMMVMFFRLIHSLLSCLSSICILRYPSFDAS